MKHRYFLIAILSLFAFTLSAQEKLDKETNTPIKKKDVFIKDTQGKTEFEGIEPDIGVLVEYISLDHKTANEMLGKFAANATNVEELRDELDQLIDKGKADLVETMWVRARSAQRAKTESVREDYYPTSYDPPRIPNTVGDISRPVSVDKNTNSTSPNVYMASAMPISFDRRNVGTTLECDPVLSSDHKLIDINLAPEIVVRLEDHFHTRKGFEKTAHGVDHIFSPTFYTMKDTTNIVVAPGKYNLLGIHTPPKDPEKRILVLLRADLISFE